MNILKYTEEEIRRFIADGICNVEALRDWQIANAKQKGERVQNIAYDQELSRMGVYKVLNKLKGKL